MGKTKKQHYVPRCYLERFQIPGKYQVHVYDKVKKETRINSIRDVAAENCFYDLKIYGETRDYLEHEQYIEHYLANEVEYDFASLLNMIINNVNNLTKWTQDNCCFLLPKYKKDLSFYLAVQYIRTKSVRDGILDTSDCMNQFLNDMGAPQSLIDSLEVTDVEIKSIHGNMILERISLLEFTSLFNSLIWVLGINKTTKMLYSSDSPIATHPHIKHPFLSMSGLSSKGVEVFLPISPNVVLIMYDGEYHKINSGNDRSYWLIDNTNVIDYYNSITAMRAHRCIYSRDGDFNLIDLMLNNNKQVFNYPKSELRWGEKVYHPSRSIV